VNTYLATSDSPRVYDGSDREHLHGFRARETYREVSPTEFIELFELAEPGKDFSTYSETRLMKRP
jgi:hypothetical protein